MGLDLIGAKLQADATGRASKRAQQSTDAANRMQAEQFNQVREDNLPLMDLRNALLPTIKDLALQDVSITPQQVMADPAYQFGLDERQRIMKNNAAARGSINSGYMMKALGRDAQDYGMSRYGDLLNRQETSLGNRFNRVLGAAGMGQAGVQQTQQAGANYANNVGNNLLNNANFRGAAGLAQSNTWGNLLNKYQDRASSYFTGGMA